jgi:hypothetical protein
MCLLFGGEVSRITRLPWFFLYKSFLDEFPPPNFFFTLDNPTPDGLGFMEMENIYNFRVTQQVDLAAAPPLSTSSQAPALGYSDYDNFSEKYRGSRVYRCKKQF